MARDGFPIKARREVDRWFERFEANLEKTFLTRIRWLTYGRGATWGSWSPLSSFRSALRSGSTGYAI